MCPMHVSCETVDPNSSSRVTCQLSDLCTMPVTSYMLLCSNTPQLLPILRFSMPSVMPSLPILQGEVALLFLRMLKDDALLVPQPWYRADLVQAWHWARIMPLYCWFGVNPYQSRYVWCLLWSYSAGGERTINNAFL